MLEKTGSKNSTQEFGSNVRASQKKSVSQNSVPNSGFGGAKSSLWKLAPEYIWMSESVSTGLWGVPGFGAGLEMGLEPSKLQKEGENLGGPLRLRVQSRQPLSRFCFALVLKRF